MYAFGKLDSRLSTFCRAGLKIISSSHKHLYAYREKVHVFFLVHRYDRGNLCCPHPSDTYPHFPCIGYSSKISLKRKRKNSDNQPSAVSLSPRIVTCEATTQGNTITYCCARSSFMGLLSSRHLFIGGEKINPQHVGGLKP